MTPLRWAFALFAAGACGGIAFALLAAARRPYPRWFGAAHGGVGLVAMGVLTYALGPVPGAPRAAGQWALALLATAFVLGVLLFRLLMPERHTLLPVLLHGGLALWGLYALWRVTF